VTVFIDMKRRGAAISGISLMAAVQTGQLAQKEILASRNENDLHLNEINVQIEKVTVKKMSHSSAK